MYWPEKQSETSSSVGSAPARSGVKGPDESALLTSAIRPPRIAQTLTPPPRCTTTMLRSASGRPRSPAARRAIAFTLSACTMLFRLISGRPEGLATGSSSSTTGGSTTNDGTPASAAISDASTAPRFDACSPWTPRRTSSSMGAFTR